MKIRQLAFTSLVFIFSISTASAVEVFTVVSDNGSIAISGSNFGSGASSQIGSAPVGDSYDQLFISNDSARDLYTIREVTNVE